MDWIEKSAIILALLTFCFAMANLTLISMDLPKIYLQVEIVIFYCCTFFVIYNIAYLMRKVYEGSRYTWQISAHIVLSLVAFLICAVTVFSNYKKLKFAVLLLLFTLLIFVLQFVLNALIFILFNRIEEKLELKLAEELNKNASLDYIRSYGCYTISLFEDGINEDAGGSTMTESISSRSLKSSKSVMFALETDIRMMLDDAWMNNV